MRDCKIINFIKVFLLYVTMLHPFANYCKAGFFNFYYCNFCGFLFLCIWLQKLSLANY